MEHQEIQQLPVAKLAAGRASLAKVFCGEKMRETVAIGRGLLGARDEPHVGAGDVADRARDLRDVRGHGLAQALADGGDVEFDVAEFFLEAIILEDADLDSTLPMLVFSGLMNCGQACVGQTRILAPRSRYDVSHTSSASASRKITWATPSFA